MMYGFLEGESRAGDANEDEKAMLHKLAPTEERVLGVTKRFIASKEYDM